MTCLLLLPIVLPLLLPMVPIAHCWFRPNVFRLIGDLATHLKVVTGQAATITNVIAIIHKLFPLLKSERKIRVGCAPPRTTISGRRRLTWKKDLTTARAPCGRSFRRGGPCRPSREGTAGLESDPTHQKHGDGKWKLLLKCRRQHCILH